MFAGDSLENLAQRVQEGDALARAELRCRLEKQMARIARRALPRSPGSSELGRVVLNPAQRLPPQGGAHPHLIQKVAANLCQTVVNRLWGGSTDARLQTQLT